MATGEAMATGHMLATAQVIFKGEVTPTREAEVQCSDNALWNIVALLLAMYV